jgi:hypothetical protein
LKKRNNIFFSIAFVLFFSISNIGLAQTFFGLKAGANVSKAYFDNEVYTKFYNTKIKPGYTVGAVFLIENKEKYGLYTEFLYSVKGKKVESDANDYESNTANYQYLDFPVLFRMKFKERKFDWFLQVGPELSYWLGGKGSMDVYQPDRDITVTYDYTINFGEPIYSSEYMNVEDPNRWQIGLAFGGGFIVDMKNANYLSLDMRLTFGHTYIGGFESGSIPNISLIDNFEYTNRVLSVSAVYYFDILEKSKLSKNKYRIRK